MTDLENKNFPNILQSFAIAGIMILATIPTGFFIRILNKFINWDMSFLLIYVLIFGITFWIVYSIRKHKTGNSTFNFGIEKKRIIPFVIISIIVLNFGISAPIISLIPKTENLHRLITVLELKSIFTFLSFVIAAPILEELIFRGIILDGLLKKYSPIKSILISSILFGLVHLNPWQFIAAFSMGVFAGWIYYKTKSVSFAIIIHVVNNLTAFLMGFFGNSDSSSINRTLVDIYGSILNLVLMLIGAIFIFAISINYLRKVFNNNNINVKEQNTGV